MPGHTKAGEFEKSLLGLSHQQLVFLLLQSFLFSGLFFPLYVCGLSEHEQFSAVISFWNEFYYFAASIFFFFFWVYQILQMLNDSNHGVREAAILCIEVSNLFLNTILFQLDLCWQLLWVKVSSLGFCKCKEYGME